MITLYAFADAFGVNPSPFCQKVNIALDLSGLDYTIEVLPDPRKAPKGKLPWLLDDGRSIADSEFILDYLRDCYDFDLDADLTPAQRAVGCAFTRLADEHFYWMLVMSRWLDDAVWPTTKEAFFGEMPAFVKPLITVIARRQVNANITGHGIGKHDQAELEVLARADIEAIGAQVDANGFVTGDAFSRADLSVYSNVVGALRGRPETWVGKLVAADPRIPAYCDRVEAWLAEARPG